ncbi:hypothetical protein HK105_200775 [Polyrhizophydium stewartii]|uniref:Uncharacterized protein n=1 Tax=Polyrhizophydium stewartii TaxID=2732419 RepID=A0ABR4NK05_9FUNG
MSSKEPAPKPASRTPAQAATTPATHAQPKLDQHQQPQQPQQPRPQPNVQPAQMQAGAVVVMASTREAGKDTSGRHIRGATSDGKPHHSTRPATQESLRYDDDFEDYDEDFEEFVEEEVASEPLVAPPAAAAPLPPDLGDLQRAMAEENERVALGKPLHDTAPARERTEPPTRSIAQLPQSAAGSTSVLSKDAPQLKSMSNLPQRQAVDLHAAHSRTQRERQANMDFARRAKRAKDLANLIDLDFVFYDIFDLAPLNEYELYVRNYGVSNASQASTQTSTDSVDRDAQTDDWLVEDKWCQAPAGELFVDCAASATALPWVPGNCAAVVDAPGGMAGLVSAEMFEEISDAARTLAASRAVDSMRLVRFLRGAAQVMDVLLEENVEGGVDNDMVDGAASFEFSRGFAELAVPEEMRGHAVADLSFTPGDYRSILIAWDGLAPLPHSAFAACQGALAVWRLNDTKRMSRMLVCEAKVTCCCFAPTKPYLVFAGTQDGGVQVWDLREPAASHTSAVLRGDSEPTALRAPSYSTDGIYVKQRAHQHPIVAAIPLHKYDGGAQAGDEDADADTAAAAPRASAPAVESASDSFQLATIDTSGFFQLWVVLELSEAEATNETDLGMRLGSRIRLIRSTHIQLMHPDRHAFSRDIAVHACTFLRNNIDRFLVGTDGGFVSHESRFRDKCFPRVFDPATPRRPTTATEMALPPPAALPRSDPVTSIETCPHAATTSLFLAGHASGLVALYTTRWAAPLMTWPHAVRHAVKRIEWSPHRPAVFSVLDEQGNLYIWDLLESDHDPRHVVAASVAASGDRRPARVVWSPTAVSATSRASLNNLLAAASRGATLVLGFDDGSVQVHRLDSQLAEMAIDEESEFAEYVRGLVEIAATR